MRVCMRVLYAPLYACFVRALVSACVRVYARLYAHVYARVSWVVCLAAHTCFALLARIFLNRKWSRLLSSW